MKCNCSYEGPGEVINKKESDAGSYWRCPGCKSSKNIQNIHGIDTLMFHMDWEKNKEEMQMAPDIFIAYKKNLDRIKFKIWTNMKNEYVWLTVEEYKFIKKWANENNLIKPYVDEFFRTDCAICNGGHIDYDCRYYVRSVVGTCRGKTMETMMEAVNQSADEFIDSVQNAL
jgi:hypothetical protein